MEENRVIKRIKRKPAADTGKPSNDSKNFFNILNVVMFIMVFIIFIRGFNIKGTVRDESESTQANVKEMIKELKTNMDYSRQIDKNEILSGFALYSRLDAQALKEREEYHKEQQVK